MNSYKNHCIFQALIWSIQEFRSFRSAKGWPIHFPSDFSDIGGLPNIVSRIAHFSIDGESTSRSQKTLDWNTWTRPSGPEERWWWTARTKTIEVDPSYKIRNRFWLLSHTRFESGWHPAVDPCFSIWKSDLQSGSNQRCASEFHGVRGNFSNFFYPTAIKWSLPHPCPHRQK